MAKILFFNPPSRDVYLSTNTSVATPNYPSLTIATLSGHLTGAHDVKVVDLDYETDTKRCIVNSLDNFKPDIVASSANTPGYFSVRDIMRVVKGHDPRVRTIVGGVHVTALSEEASREPSFDIIVLGEGDTAIGQILSRPIRDVPGVIYTDPSSLARARSAQRATIRDLDSLPFPAWPLFDLRRYTHSRISARKNPVGLIETSRGCAYQCNFCNKLTFGSEHRMKNPKRVVDEMEYALACGFKEIHIIDDSFTQVISHAKEVCQEIIRRKLSFPWSLFNGVRADMVDAEFFALAKKAGCWQAAFGIESGDQAVLDRINKKTTLDDIERAVGMAARAGIHTFGFFILGLAGDTEMSMKRTIDFARRLPLDIAKFDICIPYPGTPYYRELKEAGRIRTEDWSQYNCHQTALPLFDHPNISWQTLERYYKQSFRDYYLRPAYVARRVARSLKAGDLFHDAYYFFKARF